MEGKVTQIAEFKLKLDDHYAVHQAFRRFECLQIASSTHYVAIDLQNLEYYYFEDQIGLYYLLSPAVKESSFSRFKDERFK